jgi:hypothetical protein
MTTPLRSRLGNEISRIGNETSRIGNESRGLGPIYRAATVRESCPSLTDLPSRDR